MNERVIHSILRKLSEEKAPTGEIDLWPALQSQLQASEANESRGNPMNARRKFTPRLAAAIALAVLMLVATFLITPQGRAMAQDLLQYFTRMESDQLPIQDWQLTPVTTTGTTTSDPAYLFEANPDIRVVEQEAGFDVLEPSWIPDSLQFVGATIEEDQPIVRIFYRYVETNGLVLRQQPVPMTDDCELCETVGVSAEVQQVSILGNDGEYVEGVWKLTDQGPVWESDPYLKTMRWQANGMAFELLFMGPPDVLSPEDLIAIAESLQ
ncbi:hypothetical protein FDZ74_06440 [bacterium]|nr:MAG: hypothetical protein FDZ74_06440 [bacterium]